MSTLQFDGIDYPDGSASDPNLLGWMRGSPPAHDKIIRFADDCAPRRREGVLMNGVFSKQPCCTRDEGRPRGPGLQDQGPNHRLLL